jgi:hypothetical protein
VCAMLMYELSSDMMKRRSRTAVVNRMASFI